MQIGAIHFVATPAHVFRHPDLAAFIITLPTGFVTLPHSAIVTSRLDQNKESDPIDFGIVILDSQTTLALSQVHTFLDVMSLTPMTHDDRHALCHFAGYPASRNSVLPNAKYLPAQLYRIDAQTDKMLLKHSIISRHKTHPDDYIALRYDPRIVLPAQSDRERLKILKGMSGGAIYAGASPADDPITGEKYASHHCIGMLLEHDEKKRPTGEMMVYGLSLLAIQGVLNNWISKGLIQQ